MALARIVRPRGLRGEVAAEVLTDFPERLTRLEHVWLRDPASAAAPRRIAVRVCWLHKAQAIFHFEGCDSISDAEQLVGLEVQMPLAERVPLPEGSFYFSDLLGCEVYEVKEVEEVKGVKEVEERAQQMASPATADTRQFLSSTSSTSSTSFLGTVREVLLYGGPPLLLVETPQGELLIPFAEEICTRVDPVSRRIEVVLPDGLRDLNRR